MQQAVVALVAPAMAAAGLKQQTVRRPWAAVAVVVAAVDAVVAAVVVAAVTAVVTAVGAGWQRWWPR